jgi:integrase
VRRTGEAVSDAHLPERLKAGGDWKNYDLVFASTIGTFVDERNLRREFAEILKQAELPPMRIHDLRHSCARPSC